MSIYQMKQTLLARTTPKPPAEDGNILAWIGANAPASADLLLAHCYAGVVWGHRDDAGSWQLSSGVVDNSPALETGSLLELRVFGLDGELFTWRDASGLFARSLLDGQEGGDAVEYYDEPQILWGTRRLEKDDGPPVAGFTPLADGDLGNVHAAPLKISDDLLNGRHRPLRLYLRHYVTRDSDTGLARVANSRLVRLKPEPVATESGD